MKHFFNRKDSIVTEAIDGFLAASGLKAAAETARHGAEATAAMRKAKAGRSAYIGGQLDGVVDPGAFAVAEAFAAAAAL